MIPNFTKVVSILVINLSKYFTDFNTRILILICAGLFIANGCEGRNATETGGESKINNYEDTVFIEEIQKDNILLEEEIPLSDFFQNSKIKDSTFKAMKARRVMVFDLSSEDPDSLGLIFIPSPVSIEAIKIVDDYAYLSDNAHGNIKKICLKTGIIRTSKQFNREDYYFEEIAYFNSLLYVISHQGRLFKFSKDLNFIESFKIDEGIYLKYIYPDNQEKLKIFQYPSPNVFLDNEGNLFMRRILVDLEDNLSYDTVFVGKGKSSMIDFRMKMHGEELLVNNKLFYSVGNHKYEIPDSIEKYNWGRNISYTDDKLVFFEISLEKEKLYLHVYEYLDL